MNLHIKWNSFGLRFEVCPPTFPTLEHGLSCAGLSLTTCRITLKCTCTYYRISSRGRCSGNGRRAGGAGRRFEDALFCSNVAGAIFRLARLQLYARAKTQIVNACLWARERLPPRTAGVE